MAGALKRSVHLDAIYRLETPSQGGINNGLISSPQGVGSIDRLINQTDSMMNKMAVSQIKSNSGTESRRPSTSYKPNKFPQSTGQELFEFIITLWRDSTKQIKGAIRVPQDLHSAEFLFLGLLLDHSIIHLAHPSTR